MLHVYIEQQWFGKGNKIVKEALSVALLKLGTLDYLKIKHDKILICLPIAPRSFPFSSSPRVSTANHLDVLSFEKREKTLTQFDISDGRDTVCVTFNQASVCFRFHFIPLCLNKVKKKKPMLKQVKFVTYFYEQKNYKIL